MLPPARFPIPLAEPAVGLSTQRALHSFFRWAWFSQGPRAGNAASAVPGYRCRRDVVQLNPVHRDWPPPGRGTQPAVDVLPSPAPFGLDPSNDSPPDEVSEPVEGVLGHGVSEVFSPAACDPIDPDQHGSKVLL